MAERLEIRPQSGPQETALASSADIVIMGGAAGGGKTWSLLLEPLRHVGNPEFSAVLFRRTSPQIRNPGGMWDDSEKIYPSLGAKGSQSYLEWTFPSTAKVKFAHLQYESSKYGWQGSQIPLIGFDQLEHFSESTFFYLLSRNRSMCGVRPYIRATCNPDPDSWVASFIAWFLGEDGYPIPSRSGVLRWFIRISDDLHWADSPEELKERFSDLPPEQVYPKSMTFIPSLVTDNPALLRENPEYMGNLLALPFIERMRLLGGNWKIRATGGTLFNRAWFDIVSWVPEGGRECRFWDFASTERDLKGNDPSYTAGVKMRYVDDVWYVTDVVAVQEGPALVEKIFLRTSWADAALAREEDVEYSARWEIEPGSAGKRESARLTHRLAGIDAKGVRPRGEKFVRAKPYAVQAEQGNVRVLKGPWTDPYLNELHNQPDAPHTDRMDASSGAFRALTKHRVVVRSWEL